MRSQVGRSILFPRYGRPRVVKVSDEIRVRMDLLLDRLDAPSSTLLPLLCLPLFPRPYDAIFLILRFLLFTFNFPVFSSAFLEFPFQKGELQFFFLFDFLFAYFLDPLIC